jgi:DNA-binding response OmpR family regulator
VRYRVATIAWLVSGRLASIYPASDPVTVEEPTMIDAADSPVVLIAEDDEDIRDLIAWKLEMAGFRTVHAGDGRAALALARAHRLDAILLDVGMPGLDGLAVCEQLQQHTGTARVPVLMVSARYHDADVERGYSAGADDYIIKPFHPQDLVNRVAGLVAAA